MALHTIRFGIVGTSSIASRFALAGKEHPNFRATSVYSRSKERGAAFAQQHGISNIFTSLEAMAASHEIDAAYIASPNSLHAPQSILLLRHKKHVLCEKPIASNQMELVAMIDAARVSGVLLMEAMKTTVMPTFLALREELPRLGTVRGYFAAYCQYSSRYDAFRAGATPNAFNLNMSSGALMDIGVYTLAPLISLFGPPRKIFAQSTRLRNGIDGQGTAILSYPDMDALVLYSKIADSSLNSEILGERGTLVIDAINRMRTITFKDKSGTVEVVAEQQASSDLFHEIDEFIRTVHSGGGESPLNSHQNSLDLIRVMDEMRQQAGIVFPADQISPVPAGDSCGLTESSAS